MTLVYTNKVDGFTKRQMDVRRNTFLGMLNMLDNVPDWKRWNLIERLNTFLTFDDLKGMKIDEVHRLSMVCDDIVMTVYFSYDELISAGYMTTEEKSQAEWQSIYL